MADTQFVKTPSVKSTRMSKDMTWRWYDVFVASGLAATIFWGGYLYKTISIVESAVAEQSSVTIKTATRTTTLEANYSDILRQLGRIEKQLDKMGK